MKFSFNRSALMGLFALAMCNGQAFAEDNLAFEGFKLSLGAGMVSAGGTATTTGTGIYTEADGSGSDPTTGFAGSYNASSSTSFNPNNFIGRLELGYDWAVNENGILGLSLSKDFRSSNTSPIVGSSLALVSEELCTEGTCSSTISNFRSSPSMSMDGPYALALRAGYAATKNSMVFVKISYAQSKLTGDYNKTVRGAGLGLGFEANLSESWFMRGELEAIQYAAFDATTSFSDTFVGTVTDRIKLRSNAARIMIGVRF